MSLTVPSLLALARGLPGCLGLVWLLALAPQAKADEAAVVQRLLQNGETAAAQQRAERALSTLPPADPALAQLRFLLGVALLEQQHDAAAQAVFEKLTEDFPELPEPFNNLALLHARTGQWERARLALETALRNDPNQLTARQNLGDVHLQLALQAWQAVAEALPGDTAVARRLRLARDVLPPAVGRSGGR